MKTKNIILVYVLIILTAAFLSNIIKPNKFDFKKYSHKDSLDYVGHAQWLIDSTKSFAEKAGDGIMIDLSIKLALSMHDFENSHPSEFSEITKETNSIELAKKLKSSKNFRKIAKERELDLSKVYYVQKMQ
jgi:hypothetical protein